MPAAAVSVTCAIDHPFAFASAFVEPISKSPWPAGSSTNMNGTRNAGTVYFQHCIVVLYGSPPVMAAATNGDSNSLRAIDPLPLKRSYEINAVSRRRKLVTNDTTVAQNTDSTGEKPHIMKNTIETSDRKWNQYLRVRFQTESTRSKRVLP